MIVYTITERKGLKGKKPRLRGALDVGSLRRINFGPGSKTVRGDQNCMQNWSYPDLFFV